MASTRSSIAAVGDASRHRGLLDPGTGPDAAPTGMGATISAVRPCWIACDSTVGRIVIGPDSVPLDTGRTHRVVPPHLRRAIELRDKTCVFAACEAPPGGARSTTFRTGPTGVTSGISSGPRLRPDKSSACGEIIQTIPVRRPGG